MTPAVFLDRDGTMLHDVGYLRRLDDLRWYPWTIDAVRLLKRAGFLVLVITNQGGIGLGLLTEAFVRQVHGEMAAAIDAAGGHVDGWFFCPHHPHAQVESLRIECECRKPRPGLVYAAQRAFDIDLARSFVVGDKLADVALADGVGASGVLVRTGYGAGELARQHPGAPTPAHLADDLMAATSWILGTCGSPSDAR